MSNIKRISGFALAVLAMMCCGKAAAQSTPSPELECGEYLWPVNRVPCPEVQIKQKHDHTPLARYRRRGFDTVVTCTQEQLVLSCTPYIPAQYFNGTYFVDQIPFNPPDTTFSLGTRMPPMADDNFAPSVTQIPYPFYFFGIRKNSFILGANGCVSFSPSATGGSGCAWSYSAPIPWPDGTSGAPGSLSAMRDAIYGVYEDTDPSVTSGHSATDWGMYYGVQDTFPCRKIICSWKDMSQFSCNSMHCSYQIVCYEGSNIVEVHVAQRQVCSSWNGGRGIIGIQNATGQPQVASSDPDAPNSSPQINGKPAAFYPSNRNITTANMTNVAYRFTPDGNTLARSHWYRIFDDPNDTIHADSVELSVYDPVHSPSTAAAALNDTNGYYTPMNPTSTCPTLTKCYVKPKMTSKYVFHLRFQNANLDWYDLRDTIVIGMDTLRYIDIHKDPIRDTLPAQVDICLDDTARMRIDIHTIEEIERELWRIHRIAGGDTILLDTLVGQNGENPSSAYLNVGEERTIEIFRVTQSGDTLVLDTTLFSKADYNEMGDSLKVRAVQLFSNRLPATGLQANKIDSIYILVSADFASGCHNYDTILVRIFPNFDTVTVAHICRGQVYHWNGNDYTSDTDPNVTKINLHSTPGCDSIAHLDLTVLDVSYTVDQRVDCKPIVWINGKEYSESNTATALQDTVRLENIYGCDSIVQLDFTLYPLTARLRANVDHFSLDNLDVELTDISVNGESRVWKFPTGIDQTGPVAYYSIPSELDGAKIVLMESSPYGCEDADSIYIPLIKEHFWVPNAFTPDNPAGNSTFGSVSTHVIQEDMSIYNRHGEMVFHCNGTDCTWDGRDMRGDPCVQGAYVYVIRYIHESTSKQTQTVTGTVTLIR